MFKAAPKWKRNCHYYTQNHAECGRGTRAGGETCDTRDDKKDKPDYCGQCKFGWRRPWGNLNDWCCTLWEVQQGLNCKCQADYAQDCPEASVTSGEK